MPWAAPVFLSSKFIRKAKVIGKGHIEEIEHFEEKCCKLSCKGYLEHALFQLASVLPQPASRAKSMSKLVSSQCTAASVYICSGEVTGSCTRRGDSCARLIWCLPVMFSASSFQQRITSEEVYAWDVSKYIFLRLSALCRLQQYISTSIF